MRRREYGRRRESGRRTLLSTEGMASPLLPLPEQAGIYAANRCCSIREPEA